MIPSLISWPNFNPIKTLETLQSLPPIGKVISPRRRSACVCCRRSLSPMGRLLCPGVPICDRDDCQVTKISSVTKRFDTPYGKSITRKSLRIFSQIIELPSGRSLVQISPIVEISESLINAHIDLLRWQIAFDQYERLTDEEGYRQGKVLLIPPRTLSDVVAFRCTSKPIQLDPTRFLPYDTQEELRRLYVE